MDPLVLQVQKSCYCKNLMEKVTIKNKMMPQPHSIFKIQCFTLGECNMNKSTNRAIMFRLPILMENIQQMAGL